MDTAKLKKFAQFARRGLIEQISGKLKLIVCWWWRHATLSIGPDSEEKNGKNTTIVAQL